MSKAFSTELVRSDSALRSIFPQISRIDKKSFPKSESILEITANELLKHTNFLFVSYLDGVSDIAGYLLLSMNRMEGARIVKLAVLPQCRNMGIGGCLVSFAIVFCRRARCPKIRLHVAEHRIFAIMAYKRA